MIQMVRSSLVALLALVLVGGFAAWFALQQGRSPSPPTISMTLTSEPITVAESVYLLGGSEPAAVYAVKTCDGLVLVDSGIEDSAAAICDQLARLHVEVNQLQAILLTHVHADHSLGAARLRALTGAKIYAGRADCLPLREGSPREALLCTFDMPQLSPHGTPVDVELAGDEILAFGDAHFVALATPGHTPGSMCYLLERGGQRALFTGDVIQHLDSATEGVAGTYTAYLPPLYRGNARDYLASLRRLRALDAPDLVLPGHPRMDPVPQSPRLSAPRWRALLDHGISEMERLLARYDADGACFLDGLPKELLPGLHYLGDFGRSALYALNCPRGLFLFDAPGGPDLVEFLKARFDQLGWKGRKPTAVILTSADESAIAGLPALVQSWGCQVVAANQGIPDIRAQCPAATGLLSEEELVKRDWFDVQAIPLTGRGSHAVAYLLKWHGKRVLISGKIPVKLSQAAVEQLLRELTGRLGGKGYLFSLQKLGLLKPDLWLPSLPTHGQNANLYDDDWLQILANNALVFGQGRDK
jgi:glyoxylase-like metal-dependent hydrolase (beta-lactamase superfamily II)